VAPSGHRPPTVSCRVGAGDAPDGRLPSKGAIRFGPARAPSRESPYTAVELLVQREYKACELDFERGFWIDGTYAERLGVASMMPDGSGEMTARVVERRRAVALATTSGKSRVGRSPRSPTVSAVRRRQSRRTSTARPGRRRGRSSAATKGCPAAAAPTPSRGTARATPTPTARPATPGRSSGAGPPNGCSP
jgi:hypothetical protein